MERTAKNQILELDFRRRRAQALTGAIMQEFDRDKDTFTFWEIQQVLTEAFHRNGACVETDATRQDEGKEPRDHRGWTPSEWLAAHQARMDMMFALQQPPIVEAASDFFYAMNQERLTGRKK